jgi:hypothetical protein
MIVTGKSRVLNLLYDPPLPGTQIEVQFNYRIKKIKIKLIDKGYIQIYAYIGVCIRR